MDLNSKETNPNLTESEHVNLAAEQQKEVNFTEGKDQIAAPNFRPPTELAGDASIPQVEPLAPLESGMSGTEASVAPHAEVPTVDPKATLEKMLDTLYEQVPESKEGSTMNEILGFSADAQNSPEII